MAMAEGSEKKEVLKPDFEAYSKVDVSVIQGWSPTGILKALSTMRGIDMAIAAVGTIGMFSDTPVRIIAIFGLVILASIAPPK